MNECQSRRLSRESTNTYAIMPGVEIVPVPSIAFNGNVALSTQSSETSSRLLIQRVPAISRNEHKSDLSTRCGFSSPSQVGVTQGTCDRCTVLFGASRNCVYGLSRRSGHCKGKS